jgi:hypothetical protein
MGCMKVIWVNHLISNMEHIPPLIFGFAEEIGIAETMAASIIETSSLLYPDHPSHRILQYFYGCIGGFLGNGF